MHLQDERFANRPLKLFSLRTMEKERTHLEPSIVACQSPMEGLWNMPWFPDSKLQVRWRFAGNVPKRIANPFVFTEKPTGFRSQGIFTALFVRR
ncbi:hypothetical protein AVEN_38315-1 [Araneus ventricosus]|uniref:Uncharacterized protein n=1 Tax=Araneus ventricosus TaxID=182803 RepID=A0A4Y2V7T9_ARAVE|nr:hypothetical protein AVEN_98636-1 [Araneus ventricosus]GBO20624.1 hypothetical protein AVEN_38315-1 [Araneus ventricosus]